MYTRTITGSISKYSMTDLKDGGYAIFTVDSDTGPAADNARPVSGVLVVSDIRCYSTAAVLAIRFDGSQTDVLANTDNLSGDSTIHQEAFVLEDMAAGLLTQEPAEVYLCVDATSGTGNKCNFREECTISLDIEYMLPPELVAYTDPELVAGVTKVKAVHMTELQTNINLQREGLALSPWTFTDIRAGYTGLADWTAHVEEMRTAIDDAGCTPADGWTTIDVNSPSVAIIEELRSAVEAMLL